jgi:hypothetical protein
VEKEVQRRVHEKKKKRKNVRKREEEYVNKLIYCSFANVEVNLFSHRIKGLQF